MNKIRIINLYSNIIVLICSLIAISFFSCKQDISEVYEQYIVGDWYPVFELDMDGYYFMENGLCEYKAGYFDYILPDGPKIHSPNDNMPGEPICGDVLTNWYLDNVLHYYGNVSPYEIISDSLKLFDLSKKEWVQYKINFLSPDTLIIFKYDGEDIFPFEYKRKKYKIDSQSIFDRALFCYPKSCYSQEKFFSIDRSGHYITYGYENEGKYSLGEVQESEFKRFEMLFKKMDFEKTVKSVQGADFSDVNASLSSSVTFTKGYKMTTIKMPLRAMFCWDHKEFYWAYLAGLFFTENIRYSPYTKEKNEKYNHSIFRDFLSYKFIKNDSILNLSDTERFLLSILLIEGKESEDQFTAKYIFEGVKDNKQAKTDGRYYTFINKYGFKNTIDIGYNFIDDTGLSNSFKKIRKIN